MALRIRTETPADLAGIRDIQQAAFATMPHSRQTEHRIVDALRADGALSLSLVADDGGALVGHIAFSPVRLEGTGWYGLGPVAVLPARQGTGVGGALIRAGLAGLAHLGAAGCVVLGEPAYYGRHRFRAQASLVLPGVPPACFMAHAFRGELPTGVVAYHPAFSIE